MVKMMNKKGQMPKIKPTLGIIIGLIIILGVVYIYTTINTAKKINEDLKEIRTTVDSVNILLSKFQEFPEKIEGINQKISNIETRLNQIETDSSSFKLSEQELKQDLAYLGNVKQELEGIQKNLAKLQEAYPPVQTQNIILENATNEDITNIITNAINKKSTNLTVSFIFGSLVGISLFEFGLFVYKKYKNSQLKEPQ